MVESLVFADGCITQDQRQLDKSPTRIARNLLLGCELAPQQLAVRFRLRIRPETSMTDAPLLSVGDGAVYEVLHLGRRRHGRGLQACSIAQQVACPPSATCFGLRYDRVAIRSAASTTSTTLEIKQNRGQRIQYVSEYVCAYYGSESLATKVYGPCKCSSIAAMKQRCSKEVYSESDLT